MSNLSPIKSSNRDLALLDRVRETMGFSLGALARRFRELGQFRDWLDVEKEDQDDSVEALLRNLQRVAAGDTTMGAPLRLALILVERDWRRAKIYAEEATWTEKPGRVLMTTARDFDIHLLPQTKGRWLVSLSCTKTGYSPSWIEWQDTLDVAKVRAFVQLDDTRLDTSGGR